MLNLKKNMQFCSVGGFFQRAYFSQTWHLSKAFPESETFAQGFFFNKKQETRHWHIEICLQELKNDLYCFQKVCLFLASKLFFCSACSSWKSNEVSKCKSTIIELLACSCPKFADFLDELFEQSKVFFSQTKQTFFPRFFFVVGGVLFFTSGTRFSWPNHKIIL